MRMTASDVETNQSRKVPITCNLHFSPQKLTFEHSILTDNCWQATGPVSEPRSQPGPPLKRVALNND